MKCDIIIPVYNAFDCLKECIDSVLLMTDFSEAHLIIIDDKSPDERVLPLLEEYGKKYKDKITVLKNDENLGFVRTVNRGMRESRNDVLLLNSDTEVTKDWLKKIRRCAYLDSYVATVTPLSNNATLASVPKMFEKNELPEGYTLGEMAELVEKCSMKLYPEIPTAHGFCMYIKREVLEKVGYFDEENFGKGYGEENDFSFRCFKYGYRHLLCDDTYVLHKESQSFLDKKKMHDDELKKMHPMEKRKLDEWNERREIQIIGKNIELALGRGIRENILVVIHDFDPRNLGGTTMHVLDLIKTMRKKYNFHVLFPGDNDYKVHSFYEKSDVVTATYEKPLVIGEAQFYSLGYEKMVEEIIEKYGISYVHVHHLMGHCFSLMNACKKKKVKYAVTIHDYYLAEAEVGIIEEEVGSKENNFVDVDEWRKNSQEFLSAASEVIVPSAYVKGVLNKFFELKKVRVIEHGVDLDRGQKTWPMGQVRNIAFIGVMCPHKGIEILEGLARIAPDDLKIHLFGTLPPGKNFGSKIIEHGRYERGELPDLVKENKIDLICVFSLWPETYSYTATEAIASGVPVVAFDLGAISERIKRDGVGFTIPYTRRSEKVLEGIMKILDDKALYDETIRAINKYEIRTVTEMGKEYEDIYNKYAEVKKIDDKAIHASMVLADYVLNSDEKESKYKHDYLMMLNSRRWRMISKIKVPEGFKKMVGLLRGDKR